MHEIHDTLVGDAYDLVEFRDLPVPYQLAIAYYMAVNGEAWDLGEETEEGPTAPGDREAERRHLHRRLEVALPRLVDEHGDRVFGMALVPMGPALAHVMARDELASDWGGDWDAYHAWYVRGGEVPAHPRTERWPCIMSSFDMEAFEDGWHRFHAYARAGDADLPVVFYPEDRHFEAKGMPRPDVDDGDTPSPGMG